MHQKNTVEDRKLEREKAQAAKAMKGAKLQPKWV